MIEVSILKDRVGEYLLIRLEGHAGAGEEGHDLICAGASCCFEGAVHALKNQEKNILETHRKGLGEIKVNGPISAYDHTVLEVLEAQLCFLGSSNKDYISIKELKKGK